MVLLAGGMRTGSCLAGRRAGLLWGLQGSVGCGHWD